MTFACGILDRSSFFEERYFFESCDRVVESCGKSELFLRNIVISPLPVVSGPNIKQAAQNSVLSTDGPTFGWFRNDKGSIRQYRANVIQKGGKAMYFDTHSLVSADFLEALYRFLVLSKYSDLFS